MNPLAASGGKSRVRLEKRPVPTWLNQRSNLPSRSARKATNFPSGEISAPSSVPSQSVKRVNWALARGFSNAVTGRRASQTPTLTASATSATHGNHVARVFAEAGGDVVTSETPGNASSIASISILTSPISLRRCLGSFARQRSRSRRMGTGVAAGRADQSGSRSRIFPIVSDTVSPANATRPVNIS